MGFKRGFTLVELLVVISIITLLSSIVMGTLTGTRVKAKNVCSVMSIKQYENAFFMYETDNHGFPPTGRDPFGNPLFPNTWHCLSPYTANCGPTSASQPDGIYTPSLVLNDELHKYISGISKTCEQKIGYGSASFNGTKYKNYNNQKVCIEWPLSGEEISCGSHFYPVREDSQHPGICIMTLRGTCP